MLNFYLLKFSHVKIFTCQNLKGHRRGALEYSFHLVVRVSLYVAFEVPKFVVGGMGGLKVRVVLQFVFELQLTVSLVTVKFYMVIQSIYICSKYTYIIYLVPAVNMHI